LLYHSVAAIALLPATEQELIAGCRLVGALNMVLYEDLSFNVPLKGNTGSNALIFVVRITRTRIFSLFCASRFLSAHRFALLAANFATAGTQLPNEHAAKKGEADE
ncbi:MAG: hypothetical protein JKY56_05200, partial [Kofleriaceae bacterium]|nr:hypothetical protein [Kofleriaceae bacterium]